MKNEDFSYGDFVKTEETQELEAVEVFEYNSESDYSEEILDNPELNSSTSVVYDWEVPLYDDDGNDSRKRRKVIKNTIKARKASKKRDKGTTIGAKLILIISLLVIVSMGTITALVSYFVTQDTRINAEENNLTINNRATADCEYRLNTVLNSAALLYDLNPTNKDSEAEAFFTRNKDIVSVVFFEQNKELINQKFFMENGITLTMLDSFIVICDKNIKEAQKGITKLSNASPYFGMPLLSMIFQLKTPAGPQTVLVLFSSQSLLDSFSTGSINLSCLVNDSGDVLLHSDLEQVLKGGNIGNDYLIQSLNASTQKGEQITYTDDNGVEYIGAFTKISAFNCAVTTQVATEIILEGIKKTTLQNIYLTLAILSIAILIIWIFARSLTTPLHLLTEVVNEINQGRFDTDLFTNLDQHRRDEIGILNKSTKAEQDILNTFTKLTNKGVTKAIVLKKIDFQPHLKDITIFFSDIRGFTAISDGFNKRYGEHSAAHIIGFLNEYMERMVNCIAITGGTVDKFEGDAIMAAWGVLRDDNLDFEQLNPASEEYKEKYEKHQKNVKEDAINAIKAAVAMRYALMDYNKKANQFTLEHQYDADAPYKPNIRIGSGINIGRATVGFMGSDDKMEFTSIGDAVNMASRTESSNKPCGTDMLITQETYELLKYEYIKCENNNYTILDENKENEIVVEKIPVPFEVKGKGIQYFYGVVNMPAFDIEKFFKTTDSDFVVDPECEVAVGPKGPENLNQVRDLLGIPVPDFSGVNLGEEENKIQIHTT